MKTLYLCTFRIRWRETIDTVLVWANDEIDADRILREAHEFVNLYEVTCTPALGTPTQEPA